MPATSSTFLWRTAVELVEQMSVQAIEASLVADVPVGAYLSGWCPQQPHSVALTQGRRAHGALSVEPVKTFAAEFGDERVDETVYSQLVAKALGTDHHLVLVLLACFQAQWERLTWHRDAPVERPAFIAVAQLARAASEHVEGRVVRPGEHRAVWLITLSIATRSRAANLVPNGLRTGRPSPRSSLSRRAERSALISLRAMSGADMERPVRLLHRLRVRPTARSLDRPTPTGAGTPRRD